MGNKKTQEKTMPDAITFEQAMEELDTITQKLEAGDATLEESLTLFERGVALTSFCSKTLDEAQQKISVLLKDKAGTMTEQAFATEEDNA